MTERENISTPTPESPRGPSSTPGIPDPRQVEPPAPPVQDPSDTKNPNDPPINPALLPIGDPAGAA